MKMPGAGKGLLSLWFTGLLGLGGCGPAPDEAGAVEPEGSVAQVEQGINGYYVSFDSNSPSDLLWRNQSTGSNFAWLMNGTSHVGNVGMPGFTATYTVQATADFNPPSQTDLVIHEPAPGTERALFLTGFSISSTALLAPRASSDWYFAASGDFNSDGRSDLVLHNRVTGQWQYRYMSGPTVVTTSPIFLRPLPWYIVGAADFDMDGRTDLLWRNRSTGQNEIWRMNNTTQLGVIGMPAQSLAFYVGATADYTLDRNPDIVWHNPSTGQVLLWRLNAGLYVGALTLGGQGSGCPAWFSQATPPPAVASCYYLVGPR